MVEEWFLAFAASPWVYLAMYVLITVDGFFPPVPSESVVIALAAVAVATGEPNLWLVLAIAAAGAFTGDQIAYAIGRRVDVRATRLLRARRAQQTIDWAEAALTHRGAAFIFGSRYIPIGRVAVNMTAGALRYPRARFVGLSALAAVSWAVYSTAIGVGAGAWLHERPLVAVVVGVVSGVVIGLLVDWVLGRVQARPRRGRRGLPSTPPEGAPTGRTLVPGLGVAPEPGLLVDGADLGVAAAAPRAAGAPHGREPAAALVLPGADGA